MIGVILFIIAVVVSFGFLLYYLFNFFTKSHYDIQRAEKKFWKKVEKEYDVETTLKEGVLFDTVERKFTNKKGVRK